MKRIAVFQQDLGIGGIQKSLRNLLNRPELSELSVDLFLFQKGNGWGREAAALFPSNVHVYYLPPAPPVCKYIPFDMALSRLIPILTASFPAGVSYDAAIDFNSYQPECAAGAICIPAERRVAWVHNDVEIKLKNEWKYRVLHRFFQGKFKYFDHYVCVSEGIVPPFRRANGKYLNPDAGISVIPNVIDTAEIFSAVKEPLTEPLPDPGCMNFVALGRLCHQKGYDLLLSAFQKAQKLRLARTAAEPERYPPLRLYLIGDGPDREKLKKQAASLDLLEPDRPQVFFLGSRANPFSIMNRMDAFVSTSRYEGQGMNILEAKAVGLPVYCTKNLEPYVDGLTGYEDITAVLAFAEKQPHSPDPLCAYNQSILSSFLNLL